MQEATAQFEAGELDFEEFEDTKNELFGRLQPELDAPPAWARRR